MTFCCFRPGGAALTTRGHRTESPFTAGGRCIPPKSVASSRLQAVHTELLADLYAPVRERIESRMRGFRTRTCGLVVEPRLVVSRTPWVTHSGPQNVGTTRYVLTMGQRPPRSARRCPLRDTRASVTRPAKGEILVKVEVPSVRSTAPSTRGWLSADACEVSLVALPSLGGLRFLGVLSIPVRRNDRR
jgi:hypothetical protein